MNNLLGNLGQLQGLGGFGGGPKPLVEFKAGKLNYDGRMVKPDRRKGIIKVTQDASGMKQFQWCDADTKTPVDSFYVFPDDARFVKVKQSNDRVYLLEFSSTNQRYFYWMQEADKSTDEANAKKVHNTLNNIQERPQVPTLTATHGSGPTGPQIVSQQTAQPNVQGAPARQVPQQNQSQFQNMMTDDMMQQFFQSMQQQQQQIQSPSLSAIITPESILKLLEDESVKLSMLEHLPEGQKDSNGLRDNLLSPQFRQALSTLALAIQSDQVAVILSSLGLDTSVLNNCTDGIDALIKALVKKYSSS